MHDTFLLASEGFTPFVRASDRIGLAPPRAADRTGRHAQRRARPHAEALDSRLLMASGSVAMPNAIASSDLSARIAQVLQPYLDQDKFPGISVAVVTDGQVALAQGYGISNVATGAHVQATTRFDIGSVTKTFTAIGVLLLYQESQGTSHPLNLDAPISDYLHNIKIFHAALQVVPGHHERAARYDQRHPGSGKRPAVADPGRCDRERSAPLHSRDEVDVQRHQLRPARRAHRAVDR